MSALAADVTLAQKLAEELQYEKDAAAPADPDFLKSFKAQGIWQVRFQPKCRDEGLLTLSCRLRTFPETTRSP